LFLYMYSAFIIISYIVTDENKAYKGTTGFREIYNILILLLF